MDMYITTVDKNICVRLLCMAISSPLPLFLQRNNLCTFRDVSILKKGGAHKLNEEEFYIIRDSLQHGSMALLSLVQNHKDLKGPQLT